MKYQGYIGAGDEIIGINGIFADFNNFKLLYEPFDRITRFIVFNIDHTFSFKGRFFYMRLFNVINRARLGLICFLLL